MPPEIRSNIHIQLGLNFCKWQNGSHPNYLVYVNHDKDCKGTQYFQTPFGLRYKCPCPNRVIHRTSPKCPILGPDKKK